MASSGDRSNDAELPNYRCPIFRVPEQIRKIMPGADDPAATSFGPYHYEPETDLKAKYINKFRTRIENANRHWEDLVSEVSNIKDEAKRCYHSDFGENLWTRNGESFVDLMVRDGCVLVEVFNQLEHPEELGENEWEEVNPILRDMMLLENQIPFIVLEKIWEFLKPTKDLIDVLLWNMRDIYSPNPDAYFPITGRPLHLLHLLSLVAFPEDNSSSRQTHAADPDAAGHEQPPVLDPRVVNLLQIGVELKKNEQAGGLEASFSNGVMTMNPLKITEDTGKYLANLIAFEQCYLGGRAFLGASNYVVLMNSLIQTPADVALLSSENRGILVRPKVGDVHVNVDVARLFEELRKGIVRFEEYQGCNPRLILDWILKMEESFLTIFRVPGHIRDLNPNAYEPKIVSFGPYHHGKDRLKDMQRRKWKYLDDLFKRAQFRDKNRGGCLKAVREIENLSRYYKDYDEKDLGGAGLVEVLTLDGCFQIQFMMLASKDREEIGIERDMMLLENQIPFIVLRKISEYLGCWLDMQKNLLSFVKDIYSPNYPSSFPQNSDNPPSFPENPHHLVDLLRLEMLPPRDSSSPPRHSGPDSPLCRIPGLAELGRKGVKFIKCKEPGLRVLFENGEMRINPHQIQRNTDVYLHNVIAFEQCFSPAGKEASSYVVLMNYLIGKPEDVAVLTSRKTGILDNNLTSEEEVVHLFKNLSTGIFAFRGGSIYGDVSGYVGARRRKWLAELREKYFNSPWSAIAFLAALALLVLTCLQTTYTMKPFFKE